MTYHLTITHYGIFIHHDGHLTSYRPSQDNAFFSLNSMNTGLVVGKHSPTMYVISMKVNEYRHLNFLCKLVLENKTALIPFASKGVNGTQ